MTMSTQRKAILCMLIITVTLGAYVQVSGYDCSIAPVQLTCEYLTNPSGLDVEQPRFSWKLQATSETAHGQRQTAYRILVAGSQQQLDSHRGDMWDSGWVPSDAMQLIKNNGKPL